MKIKPTSLPQTQNYKSKKRHNQLYNLLSHTSIASSSPFEYSSLIEAKNQQAINNNNLKTSQNRHSYFVTPYFGSIFSKFKKNDEYEIPADAVGYKADLARGIRDEMEETIPIEKFTQILTPSEFKEILPKLQTTNFKNTPKNIRLGYYCADLDSQSRYSGGKTNIFEILEKILPIANDYKDLTGKDFIFALTDKDSIEGLQHVVKQFAQDPIKYSSIKLVPAIKLSFAHKAPNAVGGYENSEMIVYGINPFSKNISKLLDETIKKRREMVVQFIFDVQNLYPEFSYDIIEFATQNHLEYDKNYTISNLYWRAREYAEQKGSNAIKGRTSTPEETIREAASIIASLGKVYVGSDNITHSPFGTTIIDDSEVNKEIKEVFTKYSTHYDEKKGKMVSESENLYEDIIEMLSKESEKPIIAIANPYYLSYFFGEKDSNTFYNVVDFMKNLQDNSQGMLCAFESVSPLYKWDKLVPPERIDEFNKFIKENTDFYEVGGSIIEK